MKLDFAALSHLRTHHPAWRLLCADHAPLVAGFLHRVFVVPNARGLPAADLVEALEDELYALRLERGDETFPKTATAYLNEWASPDRGWLRKYYRSGTDEAQFDLTPETEKAISWLGQLTERSFIGTESRLLTLFELLKQMSQGSEPDPGKRIADLQERRDAIDAEIQRLLKGDVPLLDDAELKDRFQQFTNMARDLLGDFREVEYNFRKLDRQTRERIALWDGAKADLLEEIMGERDEISDSDQGRSFRAFWDFLMSSSRQEELSDMLEQVLALPAVVELKPDVRTRRVHYDWLEAGEHTQRTVAMLSQQLRRFLDDQAWLENRRIMELLHQVEARALALRQSPPANDIMTIDEVTASVDLPMERPLHSPSMKQVITDALLSDTDNEIDSSALYGQVVINRDRLDKHIRQSLQACSQITLRELIEKQPLQHGLAELVTYLHLNSDSYESLVDEQSTDVVAWDASDTPTTIVRRQARLPRVIFVQRS